VLIFSDKSIPQSINFLIFPRATKKQQGQFFTISHNNIDNHTIIKQTSTIKEMSQKKNDATKKKKTAEKEAWKSDDSPLDGAFQSDGEQNYRRRCENLGFRCTLL
jgi:hypothetical protein